MGEVLKNCPFCDGPAKRLTLGEEEPNNAGGDVIVCTRCQASSHVEFGRKENLVSRWNTRTTPTQPLEAATIERCAEQAEILYGGNGWHPYHKSAGQTIAAAIRALNTASTTPRGEDARLREALEEMVEAYSNPEAGEVDRRLAMQDARAALQGDAAHTSQEKNNG